MSEDQPSPAAALAARLADALRAKGPSYVPRTHHFVVDDGGASGGRPKYTNRLILEASPYLVQHAHNPVDWFPWGDEAFERARRLGRPVFLSVGYATCHWCHVMERESFEDEEIAAFLNEHFVSVKVDREERPDVDAVYMAAVQAASGGGGWPMSVWLTPEREPFFAGTYFPARDGDRGARRGFSSLLAHIADVYRREPERVRAAAASLAAAVREDLEGGQDGDDGGAGGGEGAGAATSRAGRAAGLVGPDGRPLAVARATDLPPESLLDDVVGLYARVFDDAHGGLRRAPKFPSNLPVRLLLRRHARTGDERASLMATRTLEKMAAGGIHDQLGGGFHRYSTDDLWLVPHFEKMLYDNALLAVAYCEAWQATGRAAFARVARETLDYLLRELAAPEGGFFSATDADSEGEEGRFFVWTEAEVRALLGDGAARFARHFGVTAAGNFHEAGIAGANVLHEPAPDETERAALAEARRVLYEARARREAPLCDDKILAAWNGLALSALAAGGRILDEPRYVAAAERAAAFLLSAMRREDGRMLRVWKDGRARQPGFLEDHAFVAAGLIDLFEATGVVRWLRAAIELGEIVDARFADRARGAWFATADDAEALLAREKPLYDGAEPSGASVALLNALRLHALTADDRWRRSADAGLRGMAAVLRDRPVALGEALLALDFLHGEPREVAVVWPAATGPDAARALLEVLRTTFAPSSVRVALSDAAAAAAAPVAAFLAGKAAAPDGRALAYVCREGRCDAPTADPEVFRRQLSRRPAGRE